VIFGEQAPLVLLFAEQEEDDRTADDDRDHAGRYAQSAPSRNELRAPAVIADAYCGYRSASVSALENDFMSVACVLLLTWAAFGALAIAALTAAA
jgi:hypothetical protein